MKHGRLFKNFGLFCALSALVGCAALREPAPKAVDWNARRAALQALDDWTVRGRIAVATAEDGWSGSLTWRQEDEDVDLSFRGPLGVGGVHIFGTSEHLEVETTRGEALTITDPEHELYREFGWTIPVYSMRYWMLGASDPRTHAEEVVDEQGLLKALTQGGWTVRYESYREFEGRLLPRKLVLQNDAVRIRLAVSNWTIEAPGLRPPG